MTTRLIIARHGNTFLPDEAPTRVGAHTDLPLVEKERGTNVGRYLTLKGYQPNIVFAAPLKRTLQTAELAINALDGSIPLEIDNSFIEIDYGPDENKTEPEVELRLGKHYLQKEGKDIGNFPEEEIMERGRLVIKDWNTQAIVPDGWKVDPKAMLNTWLTIAKKVEKDFKDKNVMVVSSNGIIRFAPYITGDFEAFAKEHDLKVTTGGVCVFEKEDNKPWTCTEWNIKPKKFLTD